MGISNSKLTSKASSKRQLNAISYDKPSRPGKPTLVPSPIGTDPDIITIRWDAPASRSTSSLKINGYIVEHRRIGSPHWVRVTPIKVRHTELTLTGLEPDCRYQFRVFAENNSGISESSPISEPLAISVNQLAASVPNFIETLKDIVVIENEKAEITVKFEGVPEPKISWYIDGKEVYSNRCVRIKTDDNSSTLIFHQVSLAYYQAEIKCTATNRAGHAVTKAILTVKAPPRIRFDRHYEEGMLFEESDNIKLKALVVGYPNPFVNWYHNGAVLTNSDRCESSYSGNISVLKIKDTRQDDAGEYQLHAINEIGEDVASIFVNVARKPQAPENIVLSKKQRNSVLLSWTQPKDNAGCKIEKYIVEYYKIGWNVWLKALSCNDLSTMLDNLIEGGQYKFRVKAENLYGVSRPSLESDVITIGNFITNSCSDVLFERSEESLDGNSTLDKENKMIKKLQAPEKPKRKKFKENYEFSKYETDQQSQMMDDYMQRVKLPPLQPHRSDKNPKLHASFDQSILHRNNLRNAESELMLVLLPDDNQQISKRNRCLLPGTMNTNEIPPPLSLSAPELGCDQPEYSTPLERNSVSSTELLRESVAARLYESMQKQFDTKTSCRSLDEGNGGAGKSSTAVTDSDRPTDIPESSAADDSDGGGADDQVFLDDESSSSSSVAAAADENSNNENRIGDVLCDEDDSDGSFDPEFAPFGIAFGEEESSGRDSVSFASVDNNMAPAAEWSRNYSSTSMKNLAASSDAHGNDYEEEEYRERDGHRRYRNNSSSENEEQRLEHREQIKVLKPILKRRVSGPGRNDVASKQPENSIDDYRSRRMKVGKKVRIAVAGETSLPDEECNGWAVGSAIAVDHYSDIVKEFNSSQKQTPTATAHSKTVYLTYDQLREVARQVDTNQFVLDDDLGSESHYERDNSPSTPNKNASVDLRGEVVDLRDKVQRKVHMLFDFALDFIMYLFAWWLYCFSSELLAVPIIALIVSRQLFANVRAWKIVKYFPFIGKKKRKNPDPTIATS